jgi:type II secretory pathway component PulK
MSTDELKRYTPANERGIALLLVLWVIVFLAFICAEFSWSMRTEASTAAHFKEGIQAYYAAEAGINRAVIELLRVSASPGSSVRAPRPEEEDTDVDTDEDFDSDEDDDGMELWLAGTGPYQFEFGDFFCEVNLVDEGNKININEFLNQSKNDPAQLKSFLEEHIGLEGEERDIVADSLIDWWDKDSNVTGLFGAEDDYYESLDPPYRSRNSDLPVIEDCLLVRGVTERIFFGRTRRIEDRIHLSLDELQDLLSGRGPDDYLDVYDDDLSEEDVLEPRLGLVDVFSVTSSASSFKININTASFEQLMLLRGMQADSANEIIAERELRLFESPTDRLPQYANYDVWKDMISVQKPFALNNYTVRARAYSRDGRISRSIRCSLLVSSARCIISDWRIDG